jgi:uroporphyrinogen III methyltransferase/synthase
MLVDFAKQGKVVARLKGGDPFVFGRGSEEAMFLRENGVDFEVIPGVTAAMGATSSCGIPLTHRGISSSAAVISGHLRRKDLEIKVSRPETLVYYMGVANLANIIKRVREEGVPGSTPCALIERGCTPFQRCVTGDIAGIAEAAHRENVSAPAILVIGDVVALRDKIASERKKPVILFTGTNPERYARLGTIIHQPMIEIVAMEDYGELDDVLGRLSEFDYVIFTSKFTVKFFFARLLAVGKDVRTLSGCKACAIGKVTASHLEGLGLKADMMPEVDTSEGILELFRRLDVKGKKILIPRSVLARDILPEELTKLGAEVKAVHVYRNVRPHLESKVDLGRVDEIFFTSPSTINNFFDEYERIPDNVKVKCIGEVTLRAARTRGLAAEVISNELPGNEASSSEGKQGS